LLAGDVLTRPINVSFYQTPIKEAMTQIAQKGGFEWSYNANILDANKKVTLISKNKTIGETLHALFGTEYTFKQSGNYLILKKVKKPQERMIGYISDPKTGQKLSNVTVYDFYNEVRGNVTGVQLSGFYNRIGGTLRGVQAAGFINMAKDAKGASAQITIDSGTMRVQSAGLFNDADTIQGAQIAGLYNHARKVKGVQIGLINWAREIDGMQIGLLNFSKKGGYVTLELSGNEVTWSNLAFKSGTRHLYTIFTAGYTPAYEDRKFLWSSGAGIGALARFNDRCGMSFDLIHRQINVEERNNLTFHGWAQFAPAFDVRIAGGLHVALGLSANVYIEEKARPDGFDYKPLVVPANFPSIKIPDAPRLSSWVGGNVALRYQF
jgi:hypothetical protein